MVFASCLNAFGITAEERFNIVKMLKKGRLISHPFINLVPLIVIVENKRNQTVKIHNEAVF